MRTAMQERFRYPLSHCQEPFWFHEIAGGGRANIAHVAFTARALDTARLADAFTAVAPRPATPPPSILPLPPGAIGLLAKGGPPQPGIPPVEPCPGHLTPRPAPPPATLP